MKKESILDKPISKGKDQISLSAFSLLFAELIQYSQARVDHVTDLEARLSRVGFDVGLRILELLCFREKNSRREIKLVGVLSFIYTSVWKALFGKAADSLEKSADNKDEYMIVDNEALVNKFISIPKQYGSLNCAAFVAGIVEGVLSAAEFTAEKVTAHFVKVKDSALPKTVILIKFSPGVIDREQT